jgi:mono/diheme cytochrome c family protein
MANVDDVRKITYGVLIGFVLMLLVWFSYLAFTGCGSALNCPGVVPTVERTSIPTLIPATLPAANRLLGVATIPPAEGSTGVAQSGAASEAVARPSNPGGPGPAVNLTGDAAAGQAIFAKNCEICHGPQGLGGNPNPGSSDGTIPPLNPIDPTLVSTNQTEFATNLDLFLEHGSTPGGPNPTFSMLAWGDKHLLMPQQIADVIAYVISLNPATAALAATPVAAATNGAPTQKEPEPTEEVARPSNPGGSGPAVNLVGDAAAGQLIFDKNCQICHGAQGLGGNPNPGSTDGTIPPLNPIDPSLKSSDDKVFVTNLDLFVEHGSTPEGTNPTFSMLAWGDKSLLTPQQIANVIAYVISLNK